MTNTRLFRDDLSVDIDGFIHYNEKSTFIIDTLSLPYVTLFCQYFL
jgi:hypothetical protein